MTPDPTLLSEATTGRLEGALYRLQNEIPVHMEVWSEEYGLDLSLAAAALEAEIERREGRCPVCRWPKGERTPTKMRGYGFAFCPGCDHSRPVVPEPPIGGDEGDPTFVPPPREDREEDDDE